MSRRSVFLDKDGVLNMLVFKNEGYTSPKWYGEFILYPGVKESIQEIKRLGYIPVIVTNQPDISDHWLGLMSTVFQDMGIEMMLAAREQGSKFYKPNTGMFTLLQEMYDIDFQRSWMVGDRWKDIVPANKLGIKTIQVLNGAFETYHPDWVDRMLESRPFYKALDLHDAVFNIISKKG